MNNIEKANISGPQKAKEHLLSLKSLLPNEVIDYWTNNLENWKQRFTPTSLAELSDKFGHIPQTPPSNEEEARKMVNFQLEHWMLGGDTDFASNLTIALNTERILSSTESNPQLIKDKLSIIGGAIARKSWENAKANNSTATDQINYLQQNQKEFVTDNLVLFKSSQQRFNQEMQVLQENSLNSLNSAALDTNVALGRDDEGYFQIIPYTGPWTQPGLLEEPKRHYAEPKGISVTFYRYNIKGEKEYFVCYGKRDAFSRTHLLTPSWQTSMSRVEKGNHPEQSYNPILKSLKDAFTQAAANNGVEIGYFDPNGNRNPDSPIAIATIDFSAYSESDQQKIIDLIKEENKGKLLHTWVSEHSLAILRRIGLLDRDGNPSPVINGFLAFSISARSPKEISLTNINRETIQEIYAQLETNPQAMLESIKLALEEPNQISQDYIKVLTIILSALSTHSKNKVIIDNKYPHQPHQLNSNS